MDQLVQCPVCTLFLHNGMTLESHLDTHPKDQVIKALCSLSTKSSNYGSRTSTPMHSERSYRSRSRTPATEDNSRWNSSHRSAQDSDRYWRRTPSRSSKAAQSSNVSRMGTPDRMGEINFENSAFGNTPQFSGQQFPLKSDKVQHSYIDGTPVDLEQQYLYYNDQSNEREIKYSRCADYAPIDAGSSSLAFNMPLVGSNVKLQPSIVPRKNNDYVKILPKPSNMVMKTNQYLGSGVKPLHVMLPTAPTFMQKNVHNNMILTGSVPTSQIMDTKAVTPIVAPTQFNQMSSATLTPGTTVVTQNSQIIFREMVHNLDGKPFLSNMPGVIGSQENISNVTQSSSMYQNVMVLDQFGNASCMYTAPPQLLQKPVPPPIYNDIAHLSTPQIRKTASNIMNDSNKTLIIEVGPIVNPSVQVNVECPVTQALSSQLQPTTSKGEMLDPSLVKADAKTDISGPNKGLKILSNIKVEVPVQHHKNMLNTVMDLTGPNESDYPIRPISPEKILPDLDDTSVMDDCTQPSSSGSDSQVSQTFSVIKNIGNPPSYKESISKSTTVDSKPDTELSDSCPVPDLICNEKPSISPCSELSEHGDNATDHIPQTDPSTSSVFTHSSLPCSSQVTQKPSSPEPRSSKSNENSPRSAADKATTTVMTHKHFKNNPLILNNIYVKKHKKVLQIKNSKIPACSTQTKTESEPVPSSSKCRSPENFSMNKLNQKENNSAESGLNTLHTISIEKIKETNEEEHREFDADTEEQEMEIEPAAGEYRGALVIKEEEGALGGLAGLEALRPIAGYAPDHYDDDSGHRELLDLETSSRARPFPIDPYFGDPVYADYFPEREPPLEARDAAPKDAWMKEPEFVLPTFIHESYKIAESGGYALEECGDDKAGVLPLQGPAAPPPWAPPAPYDLLARAAWLADDAPADDKRDHLAEAGGPASSERRGARGEAPPAPAAPAPPAPAPPDQPDQPDNTYSRLVSAKAIKKEDKQDENVLQGAAADSKEGLASSVLAALGADAAAAELDALVKLEPRRRRRHYVCPTCKVDQGSEAAFTAHLALHPLECLTCGKTFRRRANLALHLKTHLNIRNYKCGVCGKAFLTRQKLQEHHNGHSGRAPVKCTLCERAFRRYSNMVQHRDRAHLKKKPRAASWVCACGLVLGTRARLLRHQETHAPRPAACAHCPAKFVHAASLTRHVRRAHDRAYRAGPAPPDNVPCPVCSQLYLRSNLRAHVATHSGQKPFACVVCNKAFSTKWNLKLHRWTHASRSAKPYKCGQCAGAFVRRAEFEAHMNAHRAVRPYTCNYCGCRFIRKYNCQRHVREHELAKRFVCAVPDCGKAFHRSYYLSEHMKVHSGARPFACSVCGKTSSNKSNHNKHVKIHHAREPLAFEA